MRNNGFEAEKDWFDLKDQRYIISRGLFRKTRLWKLFWTKKS